MTNNNDSQRQVAVKTTIAAQIILSLLMWRCGRLHRIDPFAM